MPKTILTTTEVADRLRISGSMVRKMCQLGQLPSFKIGSLYRIDSDDLDTWIEKGKGVRA